MLVSSKYGKNRYIFTDAVNPSVGIESSNLFVIKTGFSIVHRLILQHIIVPNEGKFRHFYHCLQQDTNMTPTGHTSYYLVVQ